MTTLATSIQYSIKSSTQLAIKQKNKRKKENVSKYERKRMLFLFTDDLTLYTEKPENSLENC